VVSFFFFTVWRHFLAERVCGRPYIHCVAGFSLPRGVVAVARCGHRGRSSDPLSRATEQGRPVAGPLAVRQKPRQRYPTAGRPLGSRTLRRHGSYRPRGGGHRHPPVRDVSEKRVTPWRSADLAGTPERTSGGGNPIRHAGASGHASLGRGDPARGPGRGVGDAVSCGHRGAPARDALLGRGRGSLGAERVGASKRRAWQRRTPRSGKRPRPHPATRGTGKTSAVTQ
jgi:hypothetical protein